MMTMKAKAWRWTNRILGGRSHTMKPTTSYRIHKLFGARPADPDFAKDFMNQIQAEGWTVHDGVLRAPQTDTPPN